MGFRVRRVRDNKRYFGGNVMLDSDLRRFAEMLETVILQKGSVPECLGYEIGAPPLVDSRLPYRHVTGKIPMGHCAKLGMDLYCDEGGDTCFVIEPR